MSREQDARNLLTGTICALLPEVSLRDAERLTKAIEAIAYFQALEAIAGLGKFMESKATKK